MRRLALVAVLACSLAGAAAGQAILGTYSITPPGRPPITLVLKKDAQGKVAGSLSANGATYTVLGDMRGDDVAGTMSGAGLRSSFEAHREGTQLHLIIVDYGADGKPDYANGRELILTPSTTGGATPSADASPSPSGNPLARGAPDKFAGTFTSADVTLTLTKGSTAYSGTIKYRGTDYPATARGTGDNLAGSFKVGAQSYDMTLASAGDGKYVNLTTGGTTYMLARSGAVDGNPLAGGGSANPMAANAAPATGNGASLGATAQDQQIAKLLLSTAWCTFSFSGTSNGSSGTTRSSRAVFRADGTVSEVASGETASSGANGSVVGNNTSGQQAKWKIQNGGLMLSLDGVQWVQQPFKIADNGAGSPIVTSGGKEYMMCK